MKNVLILVALIASFPAQTAEPSGSTSRPVKASNPDKKESVKGQGFKAAFPKPFYMKSYFGPVLTGVTIIGAGAFTYFTAGAGAPVAATGVSTVASWAAGGGAGSYMAGLSTIGGWFGGNAVLGSAILNGISIGVTGGGASFAALPAIGKAGVIASISASTLDGVAAFQNPETRNLTYRVRLTVPSRLGSKEIREIVKDLEKVEESLMDEKIRSDDVKVRQAHNSREEILRKSVQMAQAVAKKGASTDDLLVLAVLSKTAGRSDLFKKLIYKVPSEKMEDTGYIDYLKSVESVERGDMSGAKNLLRKSWRLNPYAIEQPLLLINILSHEGFAAREEEIRAIAEQARENFDSDKYQSGYSMASVDYRMGTLFLNSKNYALAYSYYDKAYKDLALLQKVIGDKSMKKTIRLGMANALYGQDKKEEADALFGKVLADYKDESEKSYFSAQFAGNV